jgi:hypothetical protein
MSEDKKISHSRLIPLTDWSKYHVYPPVGGLRHLVFHSDENGFHKVVKRIGRRVLIDETAYFEWVKEKNEQEVSHA